MKKILFLSPLPPPNYGSAMSSETCLEILRNSKKFDVKNIRLNYSKSMGDIGKINFDKIKGIFKVRKEIKNTLKNFKPDIVYFVPATTSSGLIRDYFFVKEIRKHWKGKITFHIRSRILYKDWKSTRKRKILTNMLKDQKAIILGEELEKDLHNLIPKKNIFILPNAIKNELSEKSFKEIIKKRSKNKKFKILFLSNMDNEKGWPKLLQACKILYKNNIDFECNFVGEWKNSRDKTLFHNFVKANNFDKKLKYIGKKTGKEKNKILSYSDVLVFPTEYKLETFGRVIIEGMMFGLPVIANGVATIPSIIENGKTGFVLKENSPSEIALYIEKLYSDKKLRENMGKSGRKRFLKNYEIKNYEKDFLNIFT